MLLQCFRPIPDAPPPERVAKADSALAPFAELRGNISGDKHNLCRTADQVVLFGLGMRRDQREHRAPVGRSHGHPSLAGWKARIEGQAKSKLIEIEPETPVLI